MLPCKCALKGLQTSRLGTIIIIIVIMIITVVKKMMMMIIMMIIIIVTIKMKTLPSSW